MPLERLSSYDLIYKATDNRMSARPEYYSGRGAITCDLNSNLLQKIYIEVKREYGDEAAQNYVQMVADIKCLSATAFLTCFHSFVSRGCIWVRPHKETHQDVGPDNDDGARITIGMATIGLTLCGQERDETNIIRGSFLRDHRGEFEGEAKDEWGYSNYEPRRRRNY